MKFLEQLLIKTLQKTCNKNLKRVRKTLLLIEKYKLQDEQWVLHYLDDLNQMSVKY